MNQFIVKVINESRVEQLPHVSLEEEMALTFAAESYRHELEVNLNDISRTLDLTEALEGLAIVANEITEPTPAQAALIQIGGDMAVAGSDMDGSEITPSMEDIKETGAAISFQVKRAIETVIRAIKELLAKIGGVVRKYLQAIRASVGGHVQRLKVIKERLATADFSMNTNEDFTMAMPVVGDHLITNLSQVLKEAATFNVNIDSFIRYASDFNINYASGMTDLYSKLGGKGLDVVEQFNLVSKISDSVSRVSGRATTSSHVAPNLDYFDVKKFTSQDLLGGVSIVQTTALIKADPNDLSSASIRHAIEELTSHVGIKVVVKHLGFGQEDCSVKPFTKSEMEQAVKVVEALLEHFTGKSEHSSLSIAASRRLEFAETAVEHITKYIEKFDKNSISAKEYSNAALKVTNSIIQNATQPYSMLTTALNRCITLLTNAMLKSLNAHELQHRQTQFNKDHAASMQQKTKPSNESIWNDLSNTSKAGVSIEGFEKFSLESISGTISMEGIGDSFAKLGNWIKKVLAGDKGKYGDKMKGKNAQGEYLAQHAADILKILNRQYVFRNDPAKAVKELTSILGAEAPQEKIKMAVKRGSEPDLAFYYNDTVHGAMLHALGTTDLHSTMVDISKKADQVCLQLLQAFEHSNLSNVDFKLLKEVTTWTNKCSAALMKANGDLGYDDAKAVKNMQTMIAYQRPITDLLIQRYHICDNLYDKITYSSENGKEENKETLKAAIQVYDDIELQTKIITHYTQAMDSLFIEILQIFQAWYNASKNLEKLAKSEANEVLRRYMHSDMIEKMAYQIDGKINLESIEDLRR